MPKGPEPGPKAYQEHLLSQLRALFEAYEQKLTAISSGDNPKGVAKFEMRQNEIERGKIKTELMKLLGEHEANSLITEVEGSNDISGNFPEEENEY